MTNTKDRTAVDAFLAEVIEVCRKHGMSISHEDGWGAFQVRNFSESDADWLKEATDKTEPPEVK
jgi:hypothetical protein